MKKYLLQFMLAVMLYSVAGAQTVNYSEHIAPIIYNHCTSCHRPGEIAPFSLTNYQEAKNWSTMIKYVTDIKFMPPWKADPTYQRHQQENFLSDAQIQLIKDWVDGGMPQGNPALEPAVPTYPTGSQVGTPDMVLSFAQSHEIKDNNIDEYRFFVLPTGLTQDKDLVALEFRPGNNKVVHHALLWADTTGEALAEDLATPEYGYATSAGSAASSLNNQLPGYVPGAKVKPLTNGIAQRLPKNSDIKIQMHYAPSTTIEKDSSSINLFFAQQPATRYLKSKVMVPLPGVLTNGPFIIQANTVKEFHGTWTVPENISVYSVSPHMHLLGTHWVVYAVKPNGDTVHLVRINDWDFNWQGAFAFRSLIPLPKNTVIHALAGYDNTTDNPLNPNNPPQTISWGEGTSDEMYYLPIHYLAYQTGDENVVFENPTSIGDNKLFTVSNMLYPVAPNPVADVVKVGFTLGEMTKVNLVVYSLEGKKVMNVIDGKLHYEGLHTMELNTAGLRQGTYTLVMDAGGKQYTQKFIVAK